MRSIVLSHIYVQVLIAIVLGVVIGHAWPEAGTALKPLGDAFIKLVKMVIAPVIFLTLVTGLAGIREKAAIGRVVIKALAYFLTLSTLALMLGMVAANVVRPGAGLNIDVATLDTSGISTYDHAAHDSSIVGFLLAIIPETMASALTSGSILQTLLVAVLVGVALPMCGSAGARTLAILEDFQTLVFRVVGMLMRFAPLGAFGAMAFTIGSYGLGTIAKLGTLVATFYGTSALFIFIVLGLVARLAGFSLLHLIRYLREELLLVVGTSSSEPALPGLISKLTRAGVDKAVAGLVVPTGYSFNLDGTNIYMTLAALFIAQACNVDLSLGDQIALLLVAMISSKGAAGVTGAGFITLAATLSIVPTVPVAGMALILGIDRFMSECRAITNFIGNAVGAIVVARWEGVIDAEQLAATLQEKRSADPPRVADRTHATSLTKKMQGETR